MMKLVIILPILLLVGCGDDPVEGSVGFGGTSGGTLSGPIIYPNIGVSNTLLTCNQASNVLQADVELGMSKQEVRALVGKPRHVKPLVENWLYGIGKNSVDYYYWRPATTFKSFESVADESVADESVSGNESAGSPSNGTTSYLNEFSGDNTECVGDSDINFISAANSYAQIAGSVDFSNEIPTCSDAAIRIAGVVEIGMPLSQVRALVGRPVEIANGGNDWKYEFDVTREPEGDERIPFVYFTEFVQTSSGAVDYLVTGYVSPTIGCL